LIEADRLVSRIDPDSSARRRAAVEPVDAPPPGLSEPRNDEFGASRAEAGAASAKGDRRPALPSFDQFIADIGGPPGATQKKALARALADRGATLWTLGRGAEAVAAYDAIAARYGADADPAIRAEVARALCDKGAALDALGRPEEAVAVYDALEARFGADAEPAVRAEVAAALFDKGLALDRLGRREEAMAVHEALDARFGADRNPGVRVEVAAARAHRAWLAIAARRAEDSSALAAASPSLSPTRRALLDAALALARDNFGSAANALGEALTLGLASPESHFFDDLLRLLRVAEARGHGERLIGWFETSGFDIRYAPVHAAFLAMVRGERFLRDVNPEVRGPARAFYEGLTAPRRQASGAMAAPKPGRGRRRRE
jgi:tetratricopeptide (TPR) repeat protein